MLKKNILKNINTPLKKLLLVLTVFLLMGALLKAYSVYKMIHPDAITFWQVSNEKSTQKIDHARWQIILDKYLVESSTKNAKSTNNNRLFNYKKISDNDKNKLSDYLHYLQSIDPRQYGKNEQFAYWVNLYNALTIDIVLKNYPVRSIKEVGDGYSGPWNTKYLLIADQKLSLNNIEHEILRAIWQDSRIHYVINCASISCPDLLPQVLQADALEEQLNRAAKEYINHTRAISFEDNTIKLSSIFQWFSADFGQTQQDLLKHFMLYAQPDLKEKLIEFSNNTSANYQFDYNWKLNESN
jgi:hypothetical protein